MIPESNRQTRQFISARVVNAFTAFAFISVATFGFLSPAIAQQPPATQSSASLDVNRVRQLMERLRAGEKLSPDDQAYLDHARQVISARQGKAPNQPGAKNRPASTTDWSSLVPITDLTGKYKGEDGGLYGGGRNTPPEAHYAAYLKESEKIQPLDAEGRPSQDGKIGLITIGFSNTHLISMEFVKEADADAEKSPHVIVMDGAIGLRSAVMWAWDGDDILAKSEQDRLDKEMDLLNMPKANRRGGGIGGDKDTWPTLDRRLKEAGLTPRQVQAVWMKHVEANPRPLGEFPAHAKALQQDMADVLIIARQRMPNLHVAYLSSRTYAGWSGAQSGSPEPFAYESGFGTRWLVLDQINGNPRLNFDPARGGVNAPVMLWGPYIWACGDHPRKDGMTWTVDDVRSDDHLHPSDIGCKIIAGKLINFLKTDQGSRRWYLKP
jgi:hypothetical protein